MYGPRYEPPAVEKIRKAQWSVENTQVTQAVVDRLVMARNALRILYGKRNVAGIATDLDTAIARFQQLDPKVKVPA